MQKRQWWTVGCAVLMSFACSDREPESDPGRPTADAAAPPSVESDVYELVRISDDAWATVTKPGISPSRYAASLILIGEDGVLVTDSRHTPDAARELIDQVRAITHLPVRWLVNTHWHGDHTQGNQVFVDAFPDIEIYGGAGVGVDIRTLGRERLDGELARVRRRIERGRRWLEAGARDDGTPLTEEEQTALPGDLRQLEAYHDARDSIRMTPPEAEHEVDDRLALPVAEIRFVGPAHTRSDVVVWAPDSGVLAMGDLIEDGFPWFGDGYPAGWARALDDLAGLNVTYVPAHGPVLRDRELFETQRQFVTTLAARAAEAVSSGVALDRALLALDLARYEAHFTRHLDQLSAEDRAARFDAFIEEAFSRAYGEAAGDIR